MSQSHEPMPTHRHHSKGQDDPVVDSGAHGGAHVQQPTVGEDPKENPAEGGDPDDEAQTERFSAR